MKTRLPVILIPFCWSCIWIILFSIITLLMNITDSVNHLANMRIIIDARNVIQYSVALVVYIVSFFFTHAKAELRYNIDLTIKNQEPEDQSTVDIFKRTLKYDFIIWVFIAIFVFFGFVTLSPILVTFATFFPHMFFIHMVVGIPLVALVVNILFFFAIKFGAAFITKLYFDKHPFMTNELLKARKQREAQQAAEANKRTWKDSLKHGE